EEDILFLERLLSEDPFPSPPMNPNQAKSSIKEPKHSFSMGYEHFNTTLVTKLDEVAESSIKKLAPIPRECEVTSDNEIESNEPVKDDSSAFTTFLNPLFNDKDDFTSNDEDVPIEKSKVHSNLLFDNDEIKSDELESHVESNFVKSLSNHDALIDSPQKINHLEEFSRPLIPIHVAEEERIRREHAEYISRMEMLFTINLRPRPMIDIVTNTDELLPPGFENDDSEGEIDAVNELHVDNSISNSKNELSDSEESDFDNPSFPRPLLEPPDADFELDAGDEILVVRNTIDKLECLDPKDEFNDDYFPFMFVIRIFLPDLIYSKVFSFLLSAESEDTILDPDHFVEIPSGEIKDPDSVTRISKLDISNPLHLHPNNTTALNVVSIKLKGIENSQYDAMIELPKCVCNASESFKKHNQLLKLMKFLMGLDDSYMQIRSSALSREVLPDVRSAYATISSEESHRVTADEQMSTLISLIKDNKVGKICKPIWQELDNVLDISHLRIKVGHPNRTEAYISKIGNLKLSNGLTLYDVMVIPEYCVTLISVHKLAKENKVIVAFNENRCYFLNQDLNMKCVLRIEPVLNVLKDSLQIDEKDNIGCCEICQRSKQIREPFPLSDHTSKSLGDLIYLDLLGPYKTPNDDERVANDLNKGKSDSSSSSMSCSNINTADFPVDSENDANSSDGLVATQNDQSKSDYSLYTKSDKGVFLALLVYVDDIIITGNSVSEIEKFKVYLKSKFMIKDLGKLKYFLRIEVVDTDKGQSAAADLFDQKPMKT
nr:ribonuclease H-like domain-containing protein [Tanacetum cinerariifolium]